MAKKKLRERSIPVVEEPSLDRLTPEDRGVVAAAALVDSAPKASEKRVGPGLVPMEVGVALMTGRDTFLHSLRTQVEQGREIPKEQILGMIDLVIETLNEWQQFKTRLDDFQGWIEQMLAAAGEFEALGNKLAAYFRDLRKSGTKKLGGLLDPRLFQPEEKS